MKNLYLLCAMAVLSVILLNGCKTTGDREFIPGKGWVPVSEREKTPLPLS